MKLTKRLLTILFISTICYLPLFSQTGTVLHIENDAEQLLENTSDILIPSTTEDNKYYLDLEMIDGRPSDLKLVGDDDEIVLDNSLALVPENAMYELDLSNLNKGKYLLRIRTYLKEFSQTIQVF